MTKRIFYTIMTVAVSVMLASSLLFMTALYSYFSRTHMAQLKRQTELFAAGIEAIGADYLDITDLPGEEDYRTTWIGVDGGVLFDSLKNPGEMENHLEREEVKSALATGYGESQRYSSTLTQKLLYSAKRLSDGTVIRLSVAQSSLLALTMGMVQPILIILLAALLISVLLASNLSKRIVKPLNELDLDDPLSNQGYDELSGLFHRIDAQKKQIKSQSEELSRRQSEFEAVTGGMSEGIVLIGHSGEILSINPSARRLLGCDEIAPGAKMIEINRSVGLTEILERAEREGSSEGTIRVRDRILRLDASSVVSEGVSLGCALLILDVTEREKAEEQRREFTANVSHELKTPLQTISGSAELLAGGLVKSEDVPGFAKSIYSESKRLIQLVEDIIGLSRLDEGAPDMAVKSVELFSQTKAALSGLYSKAGEQGVSVELTGESVYIKGVPQLTQSIVYNLADNAIKYNRRGGWVKITVAPDGDRATLCVEDGGIGIPKSEQERIFERFYRVDKSRSKEISGTGLGLSIVKHSARLQGARLSLDSAPGRGTRITVSFVRDLEPDEGRDMQKM